MIKKTHFLFLICTFVYINICAEDPRIEYWPNGNKKSQFEMKDGKENGISTNWYEDGRMTGTEMTRGVQSSFTNH